MTTPAEVSGPEAPPPLSKEEVAYLMRAVWEALRAPKWGKSNRKDLEKLGLALLEDKSLKELDDSLYDRIAPHLVVVATALGETLRSDASRTPTAPTPPQSQPAET